MNVINAIAKARFSAARPQRITLHEVDRFRAELLCMEAGQSADVHEPAGWWYYVITGQAGIGRQNGELTAVPAGQCALTAADEPHRVRNDGPGRLVCLALRTQM